MDKPPLWERAVVMDKPPLWERAGVKLVPRGHLQCALRYGARGTSSNLLFQNLSMSRWSQRKEDSRVDLSAVVSFARGGKGIASSDVYTNSLPATCDGGVRLKLAERLCVHDGVDALHVLHRWVDLHGGA